MNIVRCEQCAGFAPEGMNLCSTCLHRAGADIDEIETAAQIMDIANIVNMGSTDKSQRAAIESILRLVERERLET